MEPALDRGPRGAGARRLILVGPYPPPWGGIAVHLRALQRLAMRHGFDVRVLDVGDGHGARTGAGGVQGAGSYAAFGRALVRTAVDEAILHVHVPGNNAKAWMVAFAASRARPGGLLSVHSGLAPALLERSPATRRLAWLACAGFRRVLCANDRIAGALEGSGVAPDRLEVLPAFVAGGVEPGRAPAPAEAARQRWKRLLAAALAPAHHYGADVLLDAVRIARLRSPDLGCVVYGPGTGDGAFAAQVERSGLAGVVVGLGEIEQPAALAVTALADAFVRPTRADGDSVSVREALGLGVRVVASDVGHRPAAATLFRAGDAAACAAAIEVALAGPPPDPDADGIDAGRRILDLWRSLGLRAIREGVVP